MMRRQVTACCLAEPERGADGTPYWCTDCRKRLDVPLVMSPAPNPDPDITSDEELDDFHRRLGRALAYMLTDLVAQADQLEQRAGELRQEARHLREAIERGEWWNTPLGEDEVESLCGSEPSPPARILEFHQ